MLHPLPFSTFREILAFGLRIEVWCPSCHGQRMPTIEGAHLDRCFARVRFRCQSLVSQGFAFPKRICGGSGVVVIRPPERIKPRNSIKRAHLFCKKCVPYWQLDDVRLDQPPWTSVTLGPDDRFRCPGCGQPVGWMWQGGDGIPHTDNYRS